MRSLETTCPSRPMASWPSARRSQTCGIYDMGLARSEPERARGHGEGRCVDIVVAGTDRDTTRTHHAYSVAAHNVADIGTAYTPHEARMLLSACGKAMRPGLLSESMSLNSSRCRMRSIPFDHAVSLSTTQYSLRKLHTQFNVQSLLPTLSTRSNMSISTEYDTSA